MGLLRGGRLGGGEERGRLCRRSSERLVGGARLTTRGGVPRYQVVAFLEYVGGVAFADDARGSGADAQTARADEVAGADLGDGLIGKGLPLANLCHHVSWFQHEPGVAVDVPPFAIPIFQGVGMPLTSFYTDNSIPVFPREPAVGVLTEGADLHAHEPIVLIPFDDQGVASGFNRRYERRPGHRQTGSWEQQGGLRQGAGVSEQAPRSREWQSGAG